MRVDAVCRSLVVSGHSPYLLGWSAIGLPVELPAKIASYKHCTHDRDDHPASCMICLRSVGGCEVCERNERQRGGAATYYVAPPQRLRCVCSPSVRVYTVSDLYIIERKEHHRCDRMLNTEDTSASDATEDDEKQQPHHCALLSTLPTAIASGYFVLRAIDDRYEVES
jgi:hypothetical protein